jgi:hypothetical protein
MNCASSTTTGKTSSLRWELALPDTQRARFVEFACTRSASRIRTPRTDHDASHTHAGPTGNATEGPTGAARSAGAQPADASRPNRIRESRETGESRRRVRVRKGAGMADIVACKRYPNGVEPLRARRSRGSHPEETHKAGVQHPITPKPFPVIQPSFFSTT